MQRLMQNYVKNGLSIILANTDMTSQPNLLILYGREMAGMTLQ